MFPFPHTALLITCVPVLFTRVPLLFTCFPLLFAHIPVLRTMLTYPQGAGTFAAGDGSRQPTALELRVAKAQGKLFAEYMIKHWQ